MSPSQPDFLGIAGHRYLVTGASGGIGRATAILASRHGARVALLGRDRARLAETLSSLEGDGHEVIEYDLADLDGIPAMVRDAAARLGGLDSVVHAAGIHSAAPVRVLEATHVADVLATNVTAPLMLARGFRDKRIEKVTPTIVLVSSVMASVGQPGVSAYAASKGAVSALVRSLALELVRDGIRVNCVEAGIVASPMTDGIRSAVGTSGFEAIEAAHPLGLGTVGDVADAILFLSSQASSWVTGTSLVVDGGYTAQ